MNGAAIIAIVFAAMLLAPGYATGVFHGTPLGPAGLVLFTLAVAAAIFFRRVSIARATARRSIAAIVAVTALHVALWALAPRPGWLAAQYRSDRFEGQPEGSTEFSIPGATRIDRAIRFADDYLPVYFLNEASFNRGIRREVVMPYSIRWTGYVEPTRTERRRVALRARGSATLTLDGAPVMSVASAPGAAAASAARDVDIASGSHVVVVSYVKPANTDPLIDVDGLDARAGGAVADAGMIVLPAPAARGARRIAALARPLSTGLDAAILVTALALGWTFAGGMRRSRDDYRDPLRAGPVRALAVAMFVLFIVQGAVTSRVHIGRAESLSGGDDWLAYEARGREVAIHGLSMSFGYPWGKGETFAYYPGYSYFLAAVHKIGGEDLFAPIFSHFVLLFATNAIVFATARRLFGPRNAVLSTAALVVIEELAFMRYYTVALFSEDVYFFTLAVAIACLVRFADEARTSDLVVAGAAAGASALIRSAMMMYLPFALVAVGSASWLQRRSPARVAGDLAVLAASWFGVVALATIRNYVVAGQFLLISDTVLPLRSFIIYNLPKTPDAVDRYLGYFDGTGLSAVQILSRIMVDHPVEFFGTIATKIGFSFGALQWMGQRFHPELFFPAIAYLAAVAVLPAARSARTWPIHGFVISHLVGMALSMPSNYGYRLILPMHLYFSMFAVALVERVTAPSVSVARVRESSV